MVEFLFWLYLLNLTLLILHEMDSAYWKEWDLFRLPGGVGGFLLIHLPLWIAGLYGLVLVREARAGRADPFAGGQPGRHLCPRHPHVLPEKGTPGIQRAVLKSNPVGAADPVAWAGGRDHPGLEIGR